MGIFRRVKPYILYTLYCIILVYYICSRRPAFVWGMHRTLQVKWGALIALRIIRHYVHPIFKRARRALHDRGRHSTVIALLSDRLFLTDKASRPRNVLPCTVCMLYSMLHSMLYSMLYSTQSMSLTSPWYSFVRCVPTVWTCDWLFIGWPVLFLLFAKSGGESSSPQMSNGWACLLRK